MLLQIITPEKLAWSGEVDKIVLPSQSGEITVLPDHVSLITALVAGEARIFQKDQEIDLFISEGSAQIKHSEVTVLVDIATQAQDLLESQILEAKKAAEKANQNKQESVEFAEVEASLKRELAKEKILQKYHRKTTQFESDR